MMMKAKKRKRHKKVCRKKNRKFQVYKKCLKASQIKNIIKYLEKKGIDSDGLNKTIKYKKTNIKKHNKATKFYK